MRRQSRELCDCLDACKRAGVPIMVTHAFIGFRDHSPTEVGLARFEQVVCHAEACGVKIALENTEGIEYLDTLLERFKDRPAVGADTTTTAGGMTTTTLLPPDITPPYTTEGGDGSWDDITELFIPFGTATVDGTKEAAWANAATVELELTKKDNPGADTTATAYVMWDEERLYFLFEITDSEIYTGGLVGDWNNDSAYLYVSEDPESYWTTFEAFAGGTYQFALVPDGLELLPRYGDTTVQLNTQLACTRTETGMIIEFSYVPYHTPPAAGNYLLMDFQYNDSNSSGVRDGALGWYNGTDVNADTGLWAVVKLLGKGEAAPN